MQDRSTVFDKAFDIVVGVEGGYVNDPQDPGGETNFGISKRSHPNVDIKNLTKKEAKDIYYQMYWLAFQCDKFKWPLNLYLFDGVVNQGSSAVVLLQQALDVDIDGIVGPKTIVAAHTATLWHCDKFLALRAQRYTQTANYAKYGLGWFIRLFNLSRHV